MVFSFGYFREGGRERESESMCANTEIKVFCRKIAKRCCVLLSVTADKDALLYFCCCDINTDQERLRRKWFIWLTLPCRNPSRSQAKTGGLKAGAQRQELEQRHGRVLLTRSHPMACLPCSLYNPGPPVQGGTTTIAWALLHQLVAKKMSHRHTQKSV